MFNVIEEPLDTTKIHFAYLTSAQLDALNTVPSNTYDTIIAFTHPEQNFTRPAFHYDSDADETYLDSLYRSLDQFSRVIKKNGTLYIYGLPQLLPYLSVYLDKKNWQFKYWLALETSHPASSYGTMVNTHEGILLYVRDKNKFNLRKNRSPHQHCDVCGDFTADWGGKSHLRHKLGYAISDVWDDLPQIKDDRHILAKEVWQRLVLLTAQEHSKILCVGYDGIQNLEHFIFE